MNIQTWYTAAGCMILPPVPPAGKGATATTPRDHAAIIPATHPLPMLSAKCRQARRAVSYFCSPPSARRIFP